MAPSSPRLFFFFLSHKCAEGDPLSPSSVLFLFHLVYRWPTHALVPPRALFSACDQSGSEGPRGLGAAGLRAAEVDVQQNPTGFTDQVGSCVPPRWAATEVKCSVGGERGGGSSWREETPDQGAVTVSWDQCDGAASGVQSEGRGKQKRREGKCQFWWLQLWVLDSN